MCKMNMYKHLCVFVDSCMNCTTHHGIRKQVSQGFE